MLKWFSKDKETELELPPELKGKTPEEIVQAMRVADTARQTAEQALNTRNSEVELQLTELAQTRQRLQELEAGGGNDQNQGNEGPTSVLVDENKAFAERLTPLAQITYSSAAIGARSLAMEQLRDMSSKDGLNHTALFSKYQKEILETMRTIPLQNQGHPDTWLNVYNLVLGRHSADLVTATKKSDGAFFTENAGGPPPPQQEKDDEKLTDAEIAQARKFGLSPEDYLKNKKGLTYVNA